MNNIAWLSHGGPGSGRYPKGSGEKNKKKEIRKKYLDIYNKKFTNNKKGVKYAAKVEYKYGKNLTKKRIDTLEADRLSNISPSKLAKYYKNEDKIISKYKEAVKSGKIDKKEFGVPRPGLYVDTMSTSAKKQAAKTGYVKATKWTTTEITQKDIIKILDKTLKTNKKYSEINEKYIHNKKNKTLVSSILKSSADKTLRVALRSRGLI